uniref:Uncharacterized protein n=1 Tax=Megaselia scalaris TaxID=36166 RepID=T1GYJ9_MEGSC
MDTVCNLSNLQSYLCNYFTFMLTILRQNPANNNTASRCYDFGSSKYLTNDSLVMDLLEQEIMNQDYRIKLFGLFVIDNNLNIGILSWMITFGVYLIQLKVE